MHPDQSHRKTRKTYNTPHHTHFLTFSCFHRQPFFKNDRSKHWLLNALQAAKEKHNFFLWAWVIMPEHIHLLIHPKERDYTIASILTAIKKPVTHACITYVTEHAPHFLQQMEDRTKNKTTHRFWQRGGGYDTNLWTPAHIHEKINYIHDNPVRRGLTKSRYDWPWSSALDHANRREHAPVSLDRNSLPW